MDEKLKWKIVNDLGRKNPKGPRGTLKPESQFRKVGNIKVATWGYQPEQIFALGFHNEIEVLRAFAPDSPPTSLRGRAFLKRKASLVWGRIYPVVNEIESQGIIGIYKITEYGSALKSFVRGYLWAECKETAQFVGETVFNGWKNEHAYIAVIPYCYGGPETLKKLNDGLVESIEKRIARKEKQVVEYQKYVEEKKKVVSILKQSSNNFYEASREAVFNSMEK